MPANSCAPCATKNGTDEMIYLDTSALVKLIQHEQESDALADWLDERNELRWITSVLTEIELPRALIRIGQFDGLAAVPALIRQLDRFEIDPVVRHTAAAYQNPSLRSLDAIHLATASIAASVAALSAVVTYDTRLAAVADAQGLTTASPGKDLSKPQPPQGDSTQ